MTKRLYEIDAYIKEFTATVVSCTAGENGYHVVLTETAFFPEGGGQAADGGTLNDLPVLDVQIKEDEILHTLSQPLDVGTTVTGRLDWQTRFARMQNHGAEHLVSGVIHRLFGYNNVGFHMSEHTMTADFDGVLTADQLAQVEQISNHAIWENVPITVQVLSGEDLKTQNYRSKLDLEEDVRLVTIEGYDCCACCAPHLAKSGEIGLVKVLDFYPNKGGTRVELVAGTYGMADYAALHNQNKQLMGLLSAKRMMVEPMVQQLSQTLKATQAENRLLQQKLAFYTMEQVTVGDLVCGFVPETTFDGLQYCANQMTAQVKVLLSPSQDGCLYVAASENGDVRPIIKALNETFGGKGGGKPTYGQGKLSTFDRQAILDLLSEI